MNFVIDCRLKHVHGQKLLNFKLTKYRLVFIKKNPKKISEEGFYENSKYHKFLIILDFLRLRFLHAFTSRREDHYV